mgnify:CR=1 FL=1
MGILHRLINLKNKLQAEIESKSQEYDEAKKANDGKTEHIKGQIAGLQKALGIVEKEYKDFLQRSG